MKHYVDAIHRSRESVSVSDVTRKEPTAIISEIGSQ
jgi:hypothetical protein